MALGSACARHPTPTVGPTPGAPASRTSRPPLVMTDPAPMPGPVIPVAGGLLKIGVCADNIVRVAYASDPAFFARATLATAGKRCVATPFTVSDEPDGKSITTAALITRVALPSGTVSFQDAHAGPGSEPILDERDGGRELHEALVWGEPTHAVSQRWDRAPDESLYGLGQHQQDLIDLDDVDLDLYQHNTEIFIPFLVSSHGYGILWDNTSFTRFGEIADAVPLPDTVGLYSTSPDAEAGDVATPARGQTVDWTGTFSAPVSGTYQFLTYSAGGIELTIGGAKVIDHWRQRWLPGEDLARVRLTEGQSVPLHLHWVMDGTTRILRLLWRPPVKQRGIVLSSEVGDGVDYTFVYGPHHDLDRVVAGYRQLTGTAPLPPRAAFGFWQSRERYRTQQESLDVVKEFRARHIPIDYIVQDWQYWNIKRWGSHEFDRERFPDPDGWIRALHAENVRLMVSVWPKFYPGTPTFDALAAGGFLFQRNLDEKQRDFLGNIYTVYDAFDPDARRLYWAQIDEKLRRRGVDAWWMDSTEPEMMDGPFKTPVAQLDANETHMTPTRLGSGARMLNAYSLVNSQAIYEGMRASAPDQRVLILTRNGFAGQQRYGAVSWSGDISSTWTALRKQIPAGLGFSISGIPYWTVDTGGFSVPYRFAKDRPDAADLDEWRELATRWFEYSTFLPILRSHGQSPYREMWQYGGDASPAFQAQLKHDRLRYRLLPYIYSLAAGVTFDGGTMLRPLVMDFPDDQRARTTGDQYLFGPALLVSPISAYRQRARPVYLPAGPNPRRDWYDFWTGKALTAGAVVDAAAPYDAIPVHVRAGSILPLGPDLQFAAEKPADPITLMIYEGAEGHFTIYEDDGTSYQYERGQSARIPLAWNQATRTLTIGAREGAFPGMRARRRFAIVDVRRDRPIPFSFEPTPDRTIEYDGAAQSIALPSRP